MKFLCLNVDSKELRSLFVNDCQFLLPASIWNSSHTNTVPAGKCSPLLISSIKPLSPNTILSEVKFLSKAFAIERQLQLFPLPVAPQTRARKFFFFEILFLMYLIQEGS